MAVNRMVMTKTSYFGEFARKEIITEIHKYHFQKAFLISDHDLDACKVTEKVETILQENTIEYEKYLEVKPNPTIENVQDGLFHFNQSGADFIIALGGGSVIDCSKAIAVIANNPNNFDVVSLEGQDKSENAAVPILAVPTTAGTGSETTMDFVITNVAEKRKMACMDSKVVPWAAILDTDIMASLPLSLSAATAMDALTHAIESYISLGAFSFSETLSLQAIKLIADNFIKVLQYPEDYEIRKELAIAQYLAGISFTNVGLGIVHSMAHPLSAFYGIPHGVANALILPYVLEYNAPSCVYKMKKIAHALDPDGPCDTLRDSIETACGRIRLFNELADLPQTLKEVGVKKSDLSALAQSAFEDVSTLDNPRRVNVRKIKKLYNDMYGD